MTIRESSGSAKIPLADNARVVLERRYLAKDSEGRPVETPEEMFRRVAHNIAQAELLYKPLEDVSTHSTSSAQAGSPSPDSSGESARVTGQALDAAARWEQRFYELMARLDFLPNSPTLMNAGRDLQQLSACFVLPVPDSIEGIFQAIKDTARIHQSGGGTGFSFSKLRPKGDRVQSSMGVASGPVSFLKVFDAATEAIKQGGTRRGANMGILAVTHPDIEQFISLKSDMRTLTNFNVSVAVTEEFMRAVEKDEEYELINPRSGEVAGRRRARHVFDLLVANAWRNGDPGIVFIDRINRDSPTPNLGEIEATNPCGEQPLLPYESCNLGSLNLAKFVKGNGRQGSKRRLDWQRLAQVIPQCVRFLDNVIDMNRYPIEEIDHATKLTRKIGLGIMGWHDALLQLRIPYDSEEALSLGEEIMRFIQEKANEASLVLSEERGPFPAFEGSRYDPDYPYRNSTRTTVAPTGTLSIVADCSSGIEPIFSLAFTRQHYLDAKDPAKMTRLLEANSHFVKVAKAERFHSDELMEYLAAGGSLQAREEVPEWARRLFVTAQEITPEWHVRMQAAFQRHTDNAVSKTINLPFSASEADVANAYWLAYREGCKGITTYREGSRDYSVLSHAAVNMKGPEQETQEALQEIEGKIATLAQTSARGGERPRPYRQRLPDERRSITHKFRVGDQEGYLTVGLYDNGRPGEIFVKIAKEGSTVSGLMDTMALLTSVTLQYGVPIEDLARKLKNTRFEPYGRTNNPHIPWATSIVDYVFRWLELKFAPESAAADASSHPSTGSGQAVTEAGVGAKHASPLQAAPPSAEATGLGCPDCGALLAYQEGCLICRSCGYNKCG
ncbi:MAG: vitamin B12-dependent ribonucleotide reductase [Chloroflexi bacterium]|nr:vitamin B12-dependent ribonucleotide reductase [Chloroflexota bacterium]